MEKNTTSIDLTAEAAAVITALAHPNGTYEYYQNTLDRLYGTILHESDELGMSDTETIHTLRVLDSIRKDLKELRDGFRIVNDTEERTPAEAVEAAFNEIAAPDPDDHHE